MLQIPTSFTVDYKYLHANALEHGRKTNSFFGSSRFGGFVLALRMVFFLVLFRFHSKNLSFSFPFLIIVLRAFFNGT